jgi:hypothetical protein
MRLFLLLPVLVFMAACSSTGGFMNPLDMNAEEKCYNARLALAIAVANDVGEDIVTRMETNIGLLCPVP